MALAQPNITIHNVHFTQNSQTLNLKEFDPQDFAAGSTLISLFTVPHSKKRKRDSDEQQQLCHETLQNGKQIPPEHYRLTLEQMESNNYPLPDIDDEGHMTCPAGFVATQPAGVCHTCVQQNNEPSASLHQRCSNKLQVFQLMLGSYPGVS